MEEGGGKDARKSRGSAQNHREGCYSIDAFHDVGGILMVVL